MILVSLKIYVFLQFTWNNSCLDEAAEIALITSFNGHIGDIQISGTVISCFLCNEIFNAKLPLTCLCKSLSWGNWTQLRIVEMWFMRRIYRRRESRHLRDYGSVGIFEMRCDLKNLWGLWPFGEVCRLSKFCSIVVLYQGNFPYFSLMKHWFLLPISLLAPD